LGIAHYFRNDLAAAEEMLSLVVAQRYECYVNCALQSIFALALTYQAQGREEAASEMAQQAANYAVEMRCAAMTPVVEVFGAQLALQQGRVAYAAQRLANWPLPETQAPLPFFFIPPLSFAKVSLALGTPDALVEVEARLVRSHTQAEQQHNPRLMMEVLALEALLAEARHDQRAALTALEQALVLAQPEGYLRPFADLGPRMAELLGRVHSRNVAPAFIQSILGAMLAPRSSGGAPNQIALIEPLTDRELEVLALLQRRMSNKEIAASLYIAPGTVKRHIHAIFEKLDASSRRDAVVRAVDLKLLELA
jgi:LuxR family maltose regulon positive regulatory protein